MEKVNHQVTTMTVHQQWDDGEVTAHGTLESRADTWPRLVMDFAKMLTLIPDGNNYYIDLEGLEAAISAQSDRQWESLMTQQIKD